MTEHAQDDFDDFGDPSSESGRRTGGRERAVFVDESYDGGGYMGREGGASDAFDPMPEPAPAGPLRDEPPARRRNDPSFEFDAVKAKRRGARAGGGRAERLEARAERREPRAERVERGAQELVEDDMVMAPERPPRRRRAARAVPERPAEREETGSGGVWWFTVLVSLIWIAGVLAFSVGYFGLPVSPPAALIDAWAEVHPRLQLMIGAIALGPLAIIWSAAFVARRARSVAQESRRLAAIVARMESVQRTAPAAAGAPADLGALEELVERMAARLGDLERHAEAQAANAARTLESEREALGGLLSDIETETARLAQAAGRSGAGAAAPDPETLAAAVAARLAPELRGVAAQAAAQAAAAAPAPTQAASPRPSPTPAPPRRAAAAAPAPVSAPAPEPAARPSSARDAVMRAAQAAAATIGQREDREPAAYGRERYAESEALEENDEAFDPEFDVDMDEADLGAETSGGGLDWAQLVRAANFPESESDEQTLQALYEVIRDKQVAALLQSAEDVLSALAEVDLFMDDITPHHAPAEKWRSYIVDGDRRDLIDLGGVRDPHAIETATHALDDRQGFEQTALIFLDRYEATLERLFQETTANKLAVELADTRTGRAYMLLARVTGRFG